MPCRRVAEEIQSGQTGYRAKLDVGHELVPLNNFFRYRNPLIQIIASFLAKRISWSSLDDDLGRAMRSRGWGSIRTSTRWSSPGHRWAHRR